MHLIVPLFVNRTIELGEFDTVLRDLAQSRPHHLALLGLRRIGKTMLLDEVRYRHPTAGIAYLPLDEIVGTPEDFARALVVGTLSAAWVATGHPRPTEETDPALVGMAGQLHPDIEPALANLLGLTRQGPGYSALLTAAMRFPAQVSRALDLPLLWMFDEFQEIVRLYAYPGTQNLLGTLRAALDRPGKVAFVVAGSRVSALRNLLGDSESPLFTRFEPLELRPFASPATAELCERLWDEDDIPYEADAAVRLHKLTGGWPFYAHAVAARARQLARSTASPVTSALIDTAFQYELLGRNANIGQQCRYLMETAFAAGTDELRPTLEAVLRQVARLQPLSRASMVRRLTRQHAQAQIYRAINRLIDTDFLHEAQGLLTLLDPVFGLWLRIEPARRDPINALGDPHRFQKLLAQLEAQHAQDRQEMGVLFERRIENLVRQFQGQSVPGKLFGVEGQVVLPTVREAGSVHLDDPKGQYGDGPDSYQVDIVALTNPPGDSWAIEAKHRRGAITAPMVARFLENAGAVGSARGMPFARLWMVAERGIRPEAKSAAQSAGVMASGMRQIEQLEHLLSASINAPALTKPPCE